MIEIIKEYKGPYFRKRAIVKNEFGLLDIDLINYSLGHKPGIDSAINKNKYFQNQIDKIHNFKFKLISNYKDGKTKVLINTDFGVCAMLPKNLLKGCIPTIRSAVNPTEYFIKLANNVHFNKYNYSLSNYKSKIQDLQIICSIHGKFNQKPSSHLSGSGCPLCGTITAQYKNKLYTKGIENAIVYGIKLIEEDGTIFYKVGFTRHSVDYRYHKKWISKSNRIRMPYKYEIIFEEHFKFKEALEVERDLHIFLSDKRYKPKYKFDGSSRECYKNINNYENIIQKRRK